MWVGVGVGGWIGSEGYVADNCWIWSRKDDAAVWVNVDGMSVRLRAAIELGLVDLVTPVRLELVSVEGLGEGFVVDSLRILSPSPDEGRCFLFPGPSSLSGLLRRFLAGFGILIYRMNVFRSRLGAMSRPDETETQREGLPGKMRTV